MMPQKLDETNKEIIRLLGEDGRKPYSAIAEDLGITENTVRSRVNKMMDSGILKIQGVVDPEYFSGLQVIFVGVKLKTMDLKKSAESFMSIRGVVSVAVVTGRYDLIVKVMISEEDGLSLLSFFSEELRKVDDVLDAETFVVYESKDLTIPFVL